MKSSIILFFLALSVTLLTATTVTAQGDDVYFINNGQLWRWPAGGTRDAKTPRRVSLPPDLPRLGSIAVNSRSIAYINTGLDGHIYRTDGETAARIHTHNGQVRQLAFGNSDDVLFYSVVATPQISNPPADGEIFALDLRTGTATRRHIVPQRTVDNAWWGAFTIEESRAPRVYVGTFGGSVYELRGTERQEQFFSKPGDQIHALMAWDGAPFLYTTGGPEVYRMRFLGERATALTLPGAKITGITYAPLPSTPAEPCELTVLASGAATLVSIFSPVVRGPNLKWLSPDLSAHGGRVNTGRYRYIVPRGIYWVSMDTRGDIAASPTPREHRVNCTGASGNAAFSF